MFSRKYDFIVAGASRQCLMTGWQIYAEKENSFHLQTTRIVLFGNSVSAGTEREFSTFAIIDAEIHARLAQLQRTRRKRAHETAEMFRKKIIKNPGKKRFSYWQSRERLCSSTKQTKSSIKQHKNCVFEFPWRNIEHSQKIRRNTKQKRKGETLKSAGCWASFHLTECQH